MVNNYLILLFMVLVTAGSLSAQGVLALLRRADLVVEARLAPAKSNKRLLMVEKVHLGPTDLKRVELIADKRISLHQQPGEQGSWLLFLRRLPGGRVHAPMQRGLAVVSLRQLAGMALRDHLQRLARAQGNPMAQATELARAATSPLPLPGASAAADLVAMPALARMLEPKAAKAVQQCFNTMNLHPGRAANMLHVLGISQPDGWVVAITRALEKKQGMALARTIGQVLATNLGSRAALILSEKADTSTNPAPLVALGATRLATAIPPLTMALTDNKKCGAAALALVLHRSPAALKVLQTRLRQCSDHHSPEAKILHSAINKF